MFLRRGGGLERAADRFMQALPTALLLLLVALSEKLGFAVAYGVIVVWYGKKRSTATLKA